MDTLIEWCLDKQLLGLEEFSGIPGTVGGSVYINLHYYQFLLEHFLVEARVIEQKTGNITSVTKEWFSFGYDQSRLQQKEHILLNATFTLTHSDPLGIAYARGRRTEIIRHRAARYPTKNTCGSFFRNFLPHEVTLEINGKKMIYVAYYLDKIGVKGTLTVGDAIVSHQHANMLVNRGNATSNDIITLAHTLQTMARDQFDVVPQPECQLLGFDTNPLL
jgi:UDP-N-acetylmuramate dehydrogenase